MSAAREGGEGNQGTGAVAGWRREDMGGLATGKWRGQGTATSVKEEVTKTGGKTVATVIQRV